MRDQDETVRVAVCRALAGHGVDAVETLQQAFADVSTEVNNTATISLAKIGTGALPALQKVLNNSDQKQKLGALLSLLRMGEIARPALGDVRACLADSEATVQLIAARTLWRIDHDVSTVPQLAKLLQGKKVTSRRGAVRLLREMGEAASPAVAELSDATLDA